MDNLILKALEHIDPSTLNYTEWAEVGMALKAEGYDCSVWDEWSQRDTARYHAGECERKWRTFKRDSGVSGGTIVKYAKDQGFYIEKGKPLDWDDEIEQDDLMAPVRRPWDRKGDFKKFIETLFKPNDFICYVTNDVYQDAEGNWKPNKGVYHKTVGEILERLEGRELEDVIGDSKPDCGAWICVNPVNGKGRYNNDVVDFRYALVESDTMSIMDQEAYFKTSGLPIATLTLSGGKSVHALVHIDAKNSQEYSQRVSELYAKLKADGMEVDEQNKNPSRLTRLPGVYRKGNEQRLIGTNIGPKSWDDWQARLVTNNLPQLEHSGDYLSKDIVLAPVLIDGILRQGHKLIISGESKSGKTWSLIELAWAIATGTKWFNEYPCERGSVIYLNLEVDNNSFEWRTKLVHEALHLESKEGLYAWNLRGKAQTLDRLLPAIIQRALMVPNLKLIIFDPIYKINPGDENNAGEMGAFCNLFDRICEEVKCSVAFCHHFAKGSSGSKRSIDRASGSGVFARDPDAILTLSRLQAMNDDDCPALRLESSLREFRDIKPLNMWFKFPLHVVDRDGILEKRGLEGSAAGNLDKSSRRQSKSEEDKASDFINAFESITKDGVTANLKDMAASAKVSLNTMKSYLKLEEITGKYIVTKGMVVLTNQE